MVVILARIPTAQSVRSVVEDVARVELARALKRRGTF